jgi:hypothetical protein
MSNDTLVPATVHPFEKAGLGVAPFKFIGVEYRVGSLKSVVDGITCEVGSPGQPMGCCDYCGQGIAECCVIKDANGKTFIVGNVCVGKTKGSDAKLVSVTEKAVKAARKLRTAERKGTRIQDAKDRLTHDAGLRKALYAMPHPNGWANKTRLDWALWMMDHAGTAGRIKVCQVIEKTEVA